MKIGILLCGSPPKNVRATFGGWTERFAHLLSGHGFIFRGWDVENMEFPESVYSADGWLITGSRHGAYEPHPFIPPLENFIRETHQMEAPLIGICFGHQIVAKAMGARVEKFSEGWAVGHRPYRIEGLGEVNLNAWHQDQVLDVPKTARVVARNDFTRYAGLQYADHCLTFQPHPEISPDMIGVYVRDRLDNLAYPPGVLQHALDLSGLPTDDMRVMNRIAEFLLSAHQRRTNGPTDTGAVPVDLAEG